MVTLRNTGKKKKRTRDKKELERQYEIKQLKCSMFKTQWRRKNNRKSINPFIDILLNP